MPSARRMIGQRLYRECTPFQRKVYEAVLRIPRGEVSTYAQVARAIGRPQAARAVGQALKRNRWAPQIPCHRVIASDGTLGGYSARGGILAKRRLLRREREQTASKPWSRFQNPALAALRAPGRRI